MNILLSLANYVVSDTYFWPSMGFTTATAMFIGVLLHDGNMKSVGKAEITIISYAFYVLLTTIPRVIHRLPNINPQNVPMAFAGATTVFFVTIFYSLGLLFGVMISRNRRKKYDSGIKEVE